MKESLTIRPESQQLNEYYNSLPYADRLVLRNKIMIALQFEKKSQFYGLVNGRNIIRPLYITIINNVIGKEIITAMAPESQKEN